MAGFLQAGRGAGKTATCARYVRDHVHGPPCLQGRQPHRVGIIGPTLGDVVEACVLGPYGLRHHDPAAQVQGQPSYQVVWPNGAQAMLFGGKNPDDIERHRAKGGNRRLLWFEEMAAIRLLQDAYDIAEPGLRAYTTILPTGQSNKSTTAKSSSSPPRPKSLTFSLTRWATCSSSMSTQTQRSICSQCGTRQTPISLDRIGRPRNKKRESARVASVAPSCSSTS